jgi:hypothetical protein
MEAMGWRVEPGTSGARVVFTAPVWATRLGLRIALAGKHAGRLATFDQAISISAVCGAKVESLCVI